MVIFGSRFGFGFVIMVIFGYRFGFGFGFGLTTYIAVYNHLRTPITTYNSL